MKAARTAIRADKLSQAPFTRVALLRAMEALVTMPRLKIEDGERVWCEGFFVHRRGSRRSCDGSDLHGRADLGTVGQAENKIHGTGSAGRKRSRLLSNRQTAHLIIEK